MICHLNPGFTASILSSSQGVDKCTSADSMGWTSVYSTSTWQLTHPIALMQSALIKINDPAEITGPYKQSAVKTRGALISTVAFSSNVEKSYLESLKIDVFWQISLHKSCMQIIGFIVCASHFVPMATVYFCGCSYVWLSLGMSQTILHPGPSLRSSAKVTADVSPA